MKLAYQGFAQFEEVEFWLLFIVIFLFGVNARSEAAELDRGDDTAGQELTARGSESLLGDLGAIWFIGDSITQSNADGDSNGSPRKSLFDLLMATNVDFTYTGHRNNNLDGLPNSDLFEYHSGVSGSCIGVNSNGRTNMTAWIPTWWNQNRLAGVKPNIALVMLGTNDIDLDDNVAGAPDRIRILVDQILSQVRRADPTPTIFISEIPPNLRSRAHTVRVIDFNNALPAVVATLQAEGKDVVLVEQWSRLNADTGSLMQDDLHTNAAGNDVLAEQLFDALHQRFAPAGFTAWQATYFGNSFVAEAGPDQDPVGEGLSNLFEFSFGSDPNTSDGAVFPLTYGESAFTVERRIADGAGISYLLEESSTLEENSWTEVDDVVVNVVSTAGDFETVELSSPSGSWETATKNFFRVRVTLNL